MQDPLVAVIIVNYNGYSLTRECLRSLARVTYNRFVLIVVDNNSEDSSVSRLRPEFPYVIYVQNDKNLGFTGGNNLGLARAFEFGVKYIFFLINDTVVSENIFDLIDFLETNPDIGMAAPLIFYYDDPEIISFGGGNLDKNSGIIVFFHKGLRREYLSDSVIFCSFLEGSAIMARAELVKKVGGFNDDYFLTSEESELCLKINDMGYRLAVLPSCSVWHKISQTMKTSSEIIVYYVYRNRLLFIRNNSIKFGLRETVAILQLYVFSFFSYLLKKRNLPAARGLVRGVIDFLRGVRGVGRYKPVLQADRK